jgi:hypothetical protein
VEAEDLLSLNEFCSAPHPQPQAKGQFSILNNVNPSQRPPRHAAASKSEFKT